MRIALVGVGLTFNGAAPVLSDIDLTIDAGEFLLIQGSSGVGKSSLLRLINRLQEPTSGRLLIDGREMDVGSVTTYRRRVGYVPQKPVMIEGDVMTNLTLPFRFRSARDATVPSKEALQAMLDEYRLADVSLDSNSIVLSVGQQQRIALIRALMTDPELLLCDEPTSALDLDSRQIVESRLESLSLDRGVGVVMVTHADYTPKRVNARRLRLSRERGLREDVL